MNAFKKTAVATVLVTISSFTLAFVPNVSTGWTLVKSLNTIKIYKEGSKENYMQVLDISKGATLELVQEYAGYIYFPQSLAVNKNMHAFNKYRATDWWNKTGNPVSLTNGAFFFTSYSPAPLSFPIRMNNSYAQGNDTDPGAIDRRQLEISGNTVDVLPYNESRIQYGPNPLVLSGLSPYFSKSSDRSVGRTFVCARYVGGASPWLMYIMSLQGEKQADARITIQNWGCDLQNKTVQLDGGGSTALVYNTGSGTKRMNGKTYNSITQQYVIEDRAVPQILVVRGN